MAAFDIVNIGEKSMNNGTLAKVAIAVPAMAVLASPAAVAGATPSVVPRPRPR